MSHTNDAPPKKLRRKAAKRIAKSTRKAAKKAAKVADRLAARAERAEKHLRDVEKKAAHAKKGKVAR